MKEKESDNEGGSPSLFSPLALAWELGYTIAVPIIGLALAGRFADKVLGTSPLLLLAGIGISIFLSSFLIYRKMKDILDQDNSANSE